MMWSGVPAIQSICVWTYSLQELAWKVSGSISFCIAMWPLSLSFSSLAYAHQRSESLRLSWKQQSKCMMSTGISGFLHCCMVFLYFKVGVQVTVNHCQWKNWKKPMPTPICAYSVKKRISANLCVRSPVLGNKLFLQLLLLLHCYFLLFLRMNLWFWKRGTHLCKEFLRPSIRTADVPWTNDNTDSNSGCLRCLWLLFISPSVKLLKYTQIVFKLMQGASNYLNLQQSSLAVSTNAPCTNATSESVILILRIILFSGLPNLRLCQHFLGKAKELLQTRLAAEMPLSRLRLRSARSACPNFLGSMVTSLAPNQSFDTVPHGVDMSNVANCSNVAHYLRHVVTIVVAERRLGTLAGFSSEARQAKYEGESRRMQLFSFLKCFKHVQNMLSTDFVMLWKKNCWSLSNQDNQVTVLCAFVIVKCLKAYHKRTAQMWKCTKIEQHFTQIHYTFRGNGNQPPRHKRPWAACVRPWINL